MHHPIPAHSVEPRWPVALTFLMVVGLLTVLPDRMRLFPMWVLYLFTIVLLTLMIVVWQSRGSRRWLRLERWLILAFCIVGLIGTLFGLVDLLREMVTGSQKLEGLYLLTSSIAVWVTNLLLFALVYWQIDLDGPESRLHHSSRHPDWLFPQASLPEDMMPNWEPTFVDYLFLAFTTATAFSPTDTLPLTPRAKLLIMAESAISLVNIAAVGARAINVLGS